MNLKNTAPLILLFAGCFICTCVGTENTPLENKKVKELFQSFRTGEAEKLSRFPSLGPEDIPALLKLAGSKRQLETFPRNPLSSQFEDSCPEGMVALWLIEGIRQSQKAGFPSLNALCLSKDGPKDDWTIASEQSHPQVLEAYKQWWANNKDRDFNKARKINPLAETRLRWH